METQTVNESTAQNETVVKLDVTGLPTLQFVEQQYLNLVLSQVGGNKVKAAKILGLSVKTIYNKLDSYKANEALRNSP